MTTTLTGKNQVTVPAEISQKLGLAPGALFDWSVGDEPRQIIIRIRPSRTDLLRRAQEIGRHSRQAGKSPIDDLINERLDDDAQEKAQE